MTKLSLAARLALVTTTALLPIAAFAADAADAADDESRQIIVTGLLDRTNSGTKTDTPLTQTPQALTVVTDDVFLAQGSLSIADTLRYVAGVVANPYGPDSRVDSAFIRGINALQFRDGMRDIFSYYASTRADPYNFSRVDVVRGPASVLFGQGSIGGLINLASKVPEFQTAGEISLRYGSFDRKEALADLTGPLSNTLAARVVARVRDADSQTDHVPDDRVMVSPSLRWQPSADTDITLLGLYQEDDGGSTAQFLPLVGTLYPNPNGKLRNDLFIGKPGWDRYDGRLLQGTGLVEHRFNDAVKISLKARYIDSDVTYLTHYPDSYTNPDDPYLDPAKRIIGLYAEGSHARLNIFGTDNNIQFKFNTGGAIEHLVLAGVDYSWNRVRKTSGYNYETIDIYNIDYAALSDYGGGIPTAQAGAPEDTRQRQIGVYVQDQIRLWDRVSIVVGGRRDHVRTKALNAAAEKASATTFRAGIIAEIVRGVSPFLSYTESFEPISGTTITLDPFKPKTGRQVEGGIKFHPDNMTLITLTGYHIREQNRPIEVILSDGNGGTMRGQAQLGELTSKGYELEASRSLPGNFQIIANYSFNKAAPKETGIQLDNVPRKSASLWGTKSFAVNSDATLRLGGGVRHIDTNYSRTITATSTKIVRTPSYTLVDALVEVSWQDWSLAVNATNLFNKKYYAACLSRGDCFIGAERNIFATLTKRF
ncbi:MAG: TonB-dependent siderophore receptor [Pseudomonadota bacterium]